MLKQTELKCKGIRTYPTFWSLKTLWGTSKYQTDPVLSSFWCICQDLCSRWRNYRPMCTLGYWKRGNRTNRITILMDSGGESSGFRHFRLLIYLFLLSEYLSVAPEGMQTNAALHHKVTLTHGTSLHILRKLSHFLSITSCFSIQNPVWCDTLN